MKFLGIFSPHISKPTEKFVGEVLFGIQASQGTLLREIGRSLHEDIKLKKTEERLCRHLAKAGLDEKIHLGLVEDALRRRKIRTKSRGALRPFGRGSENRGVPAKSKRTF